MIYKYTKCESVIAKIMSDSDMSESEMRVTDIREWIFEAIENIGAPVQYIDIETGEEDGSSLEVHDYQVPIPDDLVSLTAVAYSVNGHNGWVNVRKNDALFKNLHRHHHHHCPHRHLPMMYKLPTTQALFYHGIPLSHHDEISAIRDALDVTFFIKPGWIVLNRKHGFVKLSYKAIATDERGYPLIPDLESYKEAIYWYVMMKLLFPKFLTGKLGSTKARGAASSNMNIYNYIQQQWYFYRNKAYGEAMMPDQSDMLSIKEEWTKLIPEYDSGDIFFNSEGRRQLNYTDYYYGY